MPFLELVEIIGAQTCVVNEGSTQVPSLGIRNIARLESYMGKNAPHRQLYSSAWRDVPSHANGSQDKNKNVQPNTKGQRYAPLKEKYDARQSRQLYPSTSTPSKPRQPAGVLAFGNPLEFLSSTAWQPEFQ